MKLCICWFFLKLLHPTHGQGGNFMGDHTGVQAHTNWDHNGLMLTKLNGKVNGLVLHSDILGFSWLFKLVYFCVISPIIAKKQTLTNFGFRSDFKHNSAIITT